MELGRRQYLKGIGATVSSLSLAGCGGGGSSKYVEILHHEWVSKEDLRVKGEVKNVSEQTLSLVTIKVAWRESGAFMSNDVLYYSSVEAGATVSFEAEHAGTFGMQDNPEAVINGYSVSVDVEP